MKARSILTVIGALLLAASPLFAEEKKDDKSLVIDKEKRTIRIACKVAPRRLADLKDKYPQFEKMTEIYPIEVVSCWPAPRGQKAHETIVTHEITPSDLHKALESFGLKPGKPAKGQDAVASGPELKISLEFAGPADTTRKLPIEKTLIDKKTGKPMPNVKWRFTGSAMVKPDPTKNEEVYGADKTGTLIGIFPVTDETVIQTSLTMNEEKYIKMETNKDVLPKEGETVTLVIEVK